VTWLHSLVERIHACKGWPVEQRAALVLCANELSAICDQIVPRAPMPDVVSKLGRLLLQWGDSERWFAFGVYGGTDPVLSLQAVLSLQDKGIMHRIDTPPHDELRRALLAFFEATDA
jgi:hypothetical protein